MNDELIATLGALLGEARVLTHDDPVADLDAWERDWRGLQTGRALAVVCTFYRSGRRRGARVCRSRGIHRAAGREYGLVVGSTPDSSGSQVVLSLRDMNTCHRQSTPKPRQTDSNRIS